MNDIGDKLLLILQQNPIMATAFMYIFFTPGGILWMSFVFVYTVMALSQACVQLTCHVFKCRIHAIQYDAYGFFFLSSSGRKMAI